MQHIYTSLDEAVKNIFGISVRITGQRKLSGGDIHNAFRVSLSSGEQLFVKTNSIRCFALFFAEAEGLEALSACACVRTPRILGLGKDARKGTAFLILEYVQSEFSIPYYWETFGRELAALHTSAHGSSFDGRRDAERYGFAHDNYIGLSPQRNSPREAWIDFFRDCRLAPQLAMADRLLPPKMRQQAERLLEHLDRYLREPPFPSLLHGDLWGGNVLRGLDGKAWLIDPAVYVGDFETDLAMTQLFGGFPPSFYSAYSEANPIDKGGYSERRDIYNLYHLLNHLNLFGRSYLGSIAAILDRYEK